MKKKVYVSVAALVLNIMLSTIHADVLNPKIIGGTDAVPGAWPWIAALVYADGSSNYKGQFCGGSLVGQQWVLTSAHCVYDMKISDFKVVLGLYNLKTDMGTVATVKQTWVHPNWNSTTLSSDLALLELATPINFPVVALSVQKATAGVNAIAIGWGSTDSAGNQYPSVLQQVTLPIVDLVTCKETYPNQLSSTMICAGYPQGGKDTCTGDSGGPLMVIENGRYTQMGIASWGNGCAKPGIYGVYSDLSSPSLQKFVQDKLGSNSLISDTLGVFREGQWFLDANGNGAWDGCGTEFCFTGFGQAGDMPASGNWDGGSKSFIGVLRSGTGEWFIDLNGNRKWDGCVADGCYVDFGAPGDLPVAGDWNGTGFANIGVFRNGQWFLDADGKGTWDGCGSDLCLSFGQFGDLPVAGDWSGSGLAGVGVFRAGTWYLDYNGNGKWDGCQQDGGQDVCLYGSFGQAGDLPAAGDWNDDGKAKVGVFRNGTWFLDYNGNGKWDGCDVDRCYVGSFGQQGDLPVAGKW